MQLSNDGPAHGASRSVGYAAPIESAACGGKPIDKLFFPKELVSEIGMCKHQISFLKHKGCRFYGRKTTIRWILEYLNAYTSGAALSLPLSQARQWAPVCRPDG